MLISVDKRLVVFSMPKCGSSALVSSLGGHFGVALAGPAKMKHTPFFKYQKYLKPFLATFTEEPFETICLFREPLDWHRSWWRYRMRPRAAAKGASTAGLSFAEFLERNLEGGEAATQTGRQSKFVSDGKGVIGIDRIYRYVNIAACHAYVCERLGVSARLETENVSPARPPEEAPPEALLARHRRAYARDFEIYETVAV